MVTHEMVVSAYQFNKNLNPDIFIRTLIGNGFKLVIVTKENFLKNSNNKMYKILTEFI